MMNLFFTAPNAMYYLLGVFMGKKEAVKKPEGWACEFCGNLGRQDSQIWCVADRPEFWSDICAGHPEDGSVCPGRKSTK